VPCELVPSHLRSLKDTSFDFVITDSEISRKLASELQVPSFSQSELKPETETRIPWRCCPAAEIDLLKSEKSEHALAYQKLLATFEEHISPKKSQGNYSEDANLQSQRIDLLINHIGTIHDCINSFFNAILVHYPELDISSNPGEYGLQTFIIVQKLIDETAKNNKFLSNRLDEVLQFGFDVAAYFPELQYSATGHRWPKASWFNELLDGIKTLVRAKEDLNRETKSLQKSIQVKDRKLVDQEAELLRSRELKGAWEEKLTKENLKLDSELEATKKELVKARKLPDIAREEFYQKVQKLHAKNGEWEEKLKLEQQAHGILKLDNEACLKDLDKCRTAIEKFKKGREEFKAEYAKLQKEKDEQFQKPHNEVELLAQRKANREAKFREEKLENDLQQLRKERQIDEKTIRELSQSKQQFKEKLAEMEETQRQVLEELENERAKVKVISKDAAVLNLLKMLEEERTESKRLRELLMPAAAAAGRS
jgi:hypothetical protein